MTFKRDKKTDIKQTNLLILKTIKPKYDGESWLGHTKDGGIIDYELLEGATKDELIIRSGRQLSGVNAHLYHLKDEHGLKLSKINDNYKFMYFHYSLNKSFSNKELKDLMEIDLEQVKEFCNVELENKDGEHKWYSIGTEAPNKNNEEVLSLNSKKTFAKTLMDKKVGDYVNFGSGFKIIAIKKYLSE